MQIKRVAFKTVDFPEKQEVDKNNNWQYFTRLLYHNAKET